MSEHQALLGAVKKASEGWKNAFNSQNPEGCAAAYEEDAVMQARPFGTFRGREEILGFWTQLIGDGARDVEYIDPALDVIDERTVLLQSGWKMNVAQGVIHKEIWVLQNDGTALLREDVFEALSS